MNETVKKALRDSGTNFAGNLPEPRPGCGVASVAAVSPSWAVGPVEEFDGGFLLRPREARASLPVEFWNHELLETDEKDASSLIAFMRNWGVPYLPVRECMMFASDRQKEAVAKTEKHRLSFTPAPKRGKTNGDGIHIESGTSGTIFYVSADEAEQSVLWLKLAVLNLVYGANGAPDHKAAEIISRAACPSRVLRIGRYSDSLLVDACGTGLASCGLLTAAICSQLIESFADDAEWRICACEGCGRVFKRKRPDDGATRPHGDSKYCCTVCKDRQTKRNQRAAARNRIKH
ncbi:hypothetical protein [uncultured Slackia sp.]|uniref:hypothetical protein n=1 Tax=uncultured Slackia sp. TaxID=665903 RepID=UPI0025D52D50|nr:hypothetical protein [uncultured Slackia sp.]